MYQGRLCIPYITPTGVVQLKFRCIEDHSCKETHKDTKYIGISGVGVHMFNTRAFLIDSPIIAVTEGEIDALTVQAVAKIPAVGFPGTQSMKGFWFRAFTGYQRVLVLADGDKPGRDAAKAIAKQLPNADVVNLPDGEDANSLLINFGGPETFQELCGLVEGDSA